MGLDELVCCIELLKERMQSHRGVLSENETRTRMALIDPLLRTLGWDVSDPGVVTPEYNVQGRSADYALLRPDGQPAATIEAKRLGSGLASHRMQMLNYANAAGIAYAGLTDGNHWELYDVFRQAPLPERLILEVSLAAAPTHESTLKMLLLWRPNLASGEPIEAETSILINTAKTLPLPNGPGNSGGDDGPHEPALKPKAAAQEAHRKIKEYGVANLWQDASKALNYSTGSYYKKSGITYCQETITLPVDAHVRTSHSIKLDGPGKIRIIFSPGTVDLCRERFEQLKHEIQIDPEPPRNVPATRDEPNQWFCRLDEESWQKHKERLIEFVQTMEKAFADEYRRAEMEENESS